MSAADLITQGSLRQITEGQNPVEQPVMQCLQIKSMANQNGMQRYRVVMSDMVNFMQGMLGQRKSPSFIQWTL